MQEHTEKSNFMETIEDIRSAEQQAERIIKEAKEKADDTLRKAKENIAKMKSETEESCVSLKNDRLQKGRAGIEKGIESILKKTRQDAEQFKNKKLSDKELLDLLKTLLS